MQVQTTRLVLNSLEDWLPISGNISIQTYISDKILLLDQILKELDISFCSLGGCSSREFIQLLPSMLSLSDRLSCSAQFKPDADSIAPNYELCKVAAESSLELYRLCGNLGNFRFCASFNFTSPTPFFPAATIKESVSRDSMKTSKTSDTNYTVSIGLENGDLLFLAFFAADTVEEGRSVLSNVMRQSLAPIQQMILDVCKSFHDEHGVVVEYDGIDASLNPGLSLPDSIGAGIEHLIFPRPSEFGSFGTLAAVSAITAAVKTLPQHGIKLTGYSGLMLPVMEDIILSQRASEGRYSLRDLLTFSSVCGVGLDTVPVPGDFTIEQLASIYYETGALAYRLKKPLSCRLLPMKDLQAGDVTSVDSPYLCNTTVFKI